MQENEGLDLGQGRELRSEITRLLWRRNSLVHHEEPRQVAGAGGGLHGLQLVERRRRRWRDPQSRPPPPTAATSPAPEGVDLVAEGQRQRKE